MEFDVTGEKLPHLPVLYQEVIQALAPHSPGKYIDGTLGAGGHAWGILSASAPEGLLLGFDIDPVALEIAKRRVEEFRNRITIMQASYLSLPETMTKLGWSKVQGILLDLGTSSMQLDRSERGFSFQQDAPLDMRFNPDQPTTAADLVNELPEQELADLIWKYGEERFSRRIARRIVNSRPVLTTSQLASLVEKAISTKPRRIHPATRTFQALRIAVNNELETLEKFLPLAIEALAPAGRLAIISFHSLEDRIVKQFFRTESRDCICPPEQAVCTCQHKASITIVNRQVITAQAAEIETNPRSRSAKLRVAEKLNLA